MFKLSLGSETVPMMEATRIPSGVPQIPELCGPRGSGLIDAPREWLLQEHVSGISDPD